MSANALYAGQPIPDTGKAVYQPLWSTQAIAAAPLGTELTFFNYAQDATHGIEDTNMRKASELPAGESFDVYAMRAIFIGFNQVDLEGILANYALRLYVSNVVQLEGPVEYFAGGAGALVTYDAASAGTENVALNGIPDPRATAQMPPEYIVRITAGQTFKVNLEGTSYTVTNAATMRVILEGVYRKVIA